MTKFEFSKIKRRITATTECRYCGKRLANPDRKFNVDDIDFENLEYSLTRDKIYLFFHNGCLPRK